MNRGFTLLELVVAMILFSIVMSAAYAIFDSGQAVSSDAEKLSSVQQEARFILETIRRDLQGTVGMGMYFDAAVYQFLGTDGRSEEEPLDEIQFLALNRETLHTTEVESDLSMTRYYVIDDTEMTEQQGLVRIRNANLLSAATVQEEEEAAEEIGPNVLYLNFRYYDGNEWQENWDSTLSLTLPQAVEVVVSIQVPDSENDDIREFSSKIFLPVAAQTPALSESEE